VSGVLISGYFGAGNAGDEAVLAAMIQTLREVDPGIRIVALSADCSQTRRIHGIEAAPRMAPRSVLAALRQSRLLLSGGGSLLQDTTSVRSLLYYLAVLRMASWARVPAVVYAQGLGPLIRPQARRLTAAALRRCALITVRDGESARLASELMRGVGPPVHVVADPVFALRPEPSTSQPARFDLLIALRPWYTAPHLAEAAGAAIRELQSRGVTIGLVAMQPSADGPLAQELAAVAPGCVLVAADERPAALLSQFAAPRAVLAMRLHALIFSAVLGQPVAGLVYDPKLEAAIQQTGAVHAGHADHARSGDLVDAAVGALALANDADDAARRRDAAVRLALQARLAAELAVATLRGGRH
jgi:polysaccharide pyruvyl transferase CsaB